MSTIILIIGLILSLIAYLNLLLAYLTSTTQKPDTQLTAFDVAKEITSNYNEINIVASKETFISQYNLPRQIIRLTPHDYDATNFFAITISSLLAGYSLIRFEKNKYLDYLARIFKNLDYINKSTLLALIISFLTNTIGDAKLSLIPLTLILIYQYFIIEITTTSINSTTKIRHQLFSHSDDLTINKYLHRFITTNTILFITTLIFILRAIIIILNFT